MKNFDYFVIFAEMRTGSNFLEQNLNEFDGIACLGEAFNPAFIGFPNRSDCLGVSKETRDDDPHLLLTQIRQSADALSGFRYFHDHDPRIFDTVMEDRRCAKIVLTRNPIDSYVSLKIAQATGQWKLTDAKKRKEAKAKVNAAEFAAHVAELQAFQIRIQNRLQVTGQTAFYLANEDLEDVDVLNGLVQYLGVSARRKDVDKTLKRQNPEPLSQKVSNFEEMRNAIADLDPFNLTRTPSFEPRRGPAAPTWVTAAKSPLLYMPVRGELDRAIQKWLADLDGVTPDDLGTGHSQNDLRGWLGATPGHRSFTVLRHPLTRAHHAFCHRILNTEGGGFPAIRSRLKQRYNLPLPNALPDPSYDKLAHRKAFAAFLDFLKANLAEQTMVRVDPAWASQTQTVLGFAEFLLPDRILREDRLQTELDDLARDMGCDPVPLADFRDALPFALADIHDVDLERRARAAYGRDYTMFGFGDWSGV